MAFDLFSLPKERRDVIEAENFNKYVDKRGPDECWLWTACRNKLGYGQFFKRFGKEKYAWRAHRVAWIFKHNAPIPAGLLCCHSCDNPPCVNPEHIFIGTYKHNARDAILKGRSAKSPHSKELKLIAVKEVMNGESTRKVAKKYAIPNRTLSDWLHHPEIQKILGKIDLSHRRPQNILKSRLSKLK